MASSLSITDLGSNISLRGIALGVPENISRTGPSSNSLGGNSGVGTVPIMELFTRRKPALPTRPQPPAFEQIEEDLTCSPADVVFSLQPDCISFQAAPGLPPQQTPPSSVMASTINSNASRPNVSNGQLPGSGFTGGTKDSGASSVAQGNLGLSDSEGCYQRVRQFIEMNDRVAGFAEVCISICQLHSNVALLCLAK